MPKRVGKYEIGKTLGEGTFGKVKYAVNSDTGEQVAIKILSKAQIQQQNMGAQIKKEITIMKKVAHSNVVELKEVLASKSNIFLVLEFIQGGELFDKIVRAGRFNEVTARKYFRQLVGAIAYCHKQGVVHRDLKPENLLLDKEENLKISDFGLSNFARTDDLPPDASAVDRLLHTTCGTPNYVAPEVLADKGYDGKTADTWSIGVILYVLLAGFLPFDEPTMVSLFKKIQSGDYSFPSWFSPGARDLIGSILVVDPAQRFTLAQISEHEWFNIGYENEMSMVEQMRLEPKIEVTEGEVAAAVTEGVGIEKYRQTVKSDSGAETLNAFDVIHLVGGLALNNLFNFVKGAHLPWKRSYTFISAQGAAETFRLLYNLFEKNKDVTLPMQKPAAGALKIKDIRVEHKAQHVFISYKIYEINANVNVVEISRGRGDAIVFYKCMAKMTGAISDCLSGGATGGLIGDVLESEGKEGKESKESKDRY
mmetsp:Transcript_45624/g.67278  ORF Transcript_45624/g.67278 Transcript_45624/m.67278 type:complete len:480 (-) Transcript_45624:63-1502(-)|eukprot:CAMPEP_0195521994 /NCGR_PEP_ID=MMETSP0794_2-20130614/19841_1 /TAXON_ID=515487 /ORGANISM="Stephanopyxis turris, Strain CCMP 815" /LENGTH=479 /DNA_ID=CAMNT_0040651663 /DNA_START=139 /DNA_END=1578 /DNA_ORIENTATION=-